MTSTHSCAHTSILIFAHLYIIIISSRLETVSLLDGRTGNQALVPGPVVGVVLGGVKLLQLVGKEAVDGELPGNEAEIDVRPSLIYC